MATLRDPSLREHFDTMVAVLTEVQAEMHALHKRKRAGEKVPASALMACDLAWPSIAATWAALKHAQHLRGWTPADSAAMIGSLHRDLLLLRGALRGVIKLGDIRDN